MHDIAKYLVRTLHHRRLSNSSGALAGLASALSVLAGMIAAHFAPRGLHRLTTALHITHPPLIVRLTPLLAGIAATLATAAGIVRFYSWCKEHEEKVE